MIPVNQNAIARVMAHKSVIMHYGEEGAKKITEQLLRDHPLNDETDKELPPWAIDILKDASIGYRTRIRIAMTHHWDITGENPSWRFVQPKDMREAPPKPPPDWLTEFREKKKQVAKNYIEKLNSKKEKEI